MSILRFSGVTREIGTFVILDEIEGAVALGDRIGLVGPNGAGKTTMLRLAAGRDEPDRGTVVRKRNLTIGLLAQEAHFDAAFMAAPDLRTAVRTGAAHLDAMADELAAFERDGRVGEAGYADLQHRYEVLGGYTLDQRVDATLSGLGFSRDEWVRPPTGLSGGEQTRAALARLVIADPDLLLLDEPTNHLDLDALEWLEDHLRRRTGSLVVASHDRAFLDATVTRIWELRDRRLTAFRGDYSAYHRQREERDARATKDADTQADQIARERELVQRYRSHRKFSKMHEHEARLERLQAERREAPRAGRRLTLPQTALAGGGPARSGEIVVRVEDLAIGYLPGRGAVRPDGAPATEPQVVARVPFLAAQRGDRIGIVGPNGAGKTTLLRTIAGDLPPLDGSLSFGNAVQLGYLAQLRGAAIPGTTVLDALLDTIPVTPAKRAPTSPASCSAGTTPSRRSARCRAGSGRGSSSRCSGSSRPTCCSWTSRPTTSTSRPARRSRRSCASRRRRCWWSRMTGGCSRPCATGCGSWGMGRRRRSMAGYRAWRQAVAAGWTVADGVAERAKRYRAGRGREHRSFIACGRWQSLSSRRRRRGPGRCRRRGGPPGRAPAARPGPGRSWRSCRRMRIGSRRVALDAELTRLGLRKSHLELAMGDPAVAANFVEMRRVTSELADVDTALAAAEDAWLQLEERAP